MKPTAAFAMSIARNHNSDFDDSWFAQGAVQSAKRAYNKKLI